MKASQNTIMMKVRLGWILLGISAVVLLAGLIIRLNDPVLGEKIHWVMGLAIFTLGLSIALLVANLPALRSPQAAARQVNSETDERNISIRNAAGYIAFLASIIANFILLFVYSIMTRGVEGFDPLWYALAFLSVFPVAIYLLFVTRYQKKM